MSKEVLTFEEVVLLLKEVCVTDKENLIISYILRNSGKKLLWMKHVPHICLS